MSDPFTNISIKARNVEISGHDRENVYVNLENVDIDDLMDEVGRDRLVERDTEGLLDSMNIDTVISWLKYQGYNVTEEE